MVNICLYRTSFQKQKIYVEILPSYPPPTSRSYSDLSLLKMILGTVPKLESD